MKQVTVYVDHFYYEYIPRYTNRFIIWLHPKLHASDHAGDIGHQYCYGLVSLQFAANMITSGEKYLIIPHTYSLCFLKPVVYEILSQSVSESQKIYAANCQDDPQCLSIDQIVLLNSELGVHLKEEIEVEDIIVDVLLTYLLNLEKNEMLLLIRNENYHVWSAYCTDKNVVICDNQEHERTNDKGEKTLYGGVLYCIWKEQHSLKNTLEYIRYISGSFQGGCKLGVIQIDIPIVDI